MTQGNFGEDKCCNDIESVEYFLSDDLINSKKYNKLDMHDFQRIKDKNVIFYLKNLVKYISKDLISLFDANINFAISCKIIPLNNKDSYTDYLESDFRFDDAINFKECWSQEKRQSPSLYILCNRDHEIKDILNKILDSDTSSTTFAESGESLRKNGRYNEAIKAFDKAIGLCPSNSWAFERKGATLRELSLYEESIASLNRALEIDSRNAWTHAELGESLRLNGRLEEAIKEFDLAISIQPKLGWAFERKGATLRDLQKINESIDSLNHAIELDPENAWIFAELAESLYKNGNRKEALEALKTAINMNLEKSSIFEKLGIVLRNLGNNSGSISALEKALEIEPNNAKTLVEYSESLRLCGRDVKALDVVNKALSIDSNFSLAKETKAAICNELNSCEYALKLINEVLDEENKSPNTINLKARKIKALILNNSALYENAILTINDVIKIEKENYWSLIIKGWILENLNKFEDALVSYNIALDLKDKFDIERIKCCAYVGCGNSYYSLYLCEGKQRTDYLNKSLENYEKGLNLLQTQKDNIDGYTLSRIGWCLFRLRNYEEAERLFIDAFSLHPERIESHFSLGLNLICRNRLDLALDEYRKGIELARKKSDRARRKGLKSMAIRYLDETLAYDNELKENESVKEIISLLEDLV